LKAFVVNRPYRTLERAICEPGFEFDGGWRWEDRWSPLRKVQIGKQAKFKEIAYAVALSLLHELVKKLVGKEAHAEVEKQSLF